MTTDNVVRPQAFTSMVAAALRAVSCHVGPVGVFSFRFVCRGCELLFVVSADLTAYSIVDRGDNVRGAGAISRVDDILTVRAIFEVLEREVIV